MQLLTRISSAAVLAVAGVCAVVTADDLPPTPPTPAGVLDLAYAQPFVLDQSYSHAWRKENPQVTSGYLLVLKVHRDYVVPRNSLEPVLYVGAQTAERINFGQESGYVVALVPAPLTEAGTVDLDLTKAMMWFGTPALPEQVDAAKIAGEAALAQRAGVKPFSAEKIQQVMHDQVTLTDMRSLLTHLAPLIMQYSPQDKDRAQQFLQDQPAAATPAKR